MIGVIPITPIRYGIINSAPNFATSLSGEPAGNPDSLVVGSSVSSVVNTDSSGYWDAGNYNVGPTLSSNDGNAALFAGDYTLTSNDATLTITPATLTISATSDTKVYDSTTAVTGVTPTVTGLKGSDTVTDAATGGAVTEGFSSPNVLGTDGHGTNNMVIDPFLVNDGTYGQNYNITVNTAAGTITPANANLSVTGYDVTYDGNTHTATGSATGISDVDLSSDLDLAGTTHTNAGSYADTWTFSDPTGNYAPEHGSLTDNIAQANPNVITTDFGGVYNGEPYAATVTVNGNTSLEGVTPTITYEQQDANGNGPDPQKRSGSSTLRVFLP